MNEFLALWLRAAKSKVGLSIETDNRRLLQKDLYEARMESGLPELQELCISVPKDPTKLYILRKDADGEPS